MEITDLHPIFKSSEYIFRFYVGQVDCLFEKLSQSNTEKALTRACSLRMKVLGIWRKGPLSVKP